ncbi:MAG: hypothetical protein Q4B75_09685 [Eubacteriales bacterium]|nr:hypothetical protein [Eubacteriales bacterium]
MTELETLERARMYMEKLANGINPIDGSVIPDEDIVNNVRLSRCFFYVSDVLRQVIENGGVTPQKKIKKEPFSLTVEQREAFDFSAVPIPISEISKRINMLSTNENMSTLSYAAIRDWLMSLGMLEHALDGNGKNVVHPTPQGESIGIALEARNGANGPYYVVVYNLAAQHFILDNLDAIIDYSSAKTENQGQPWSPEHDRCLLDLHHKGVPVQEIAVTLKRGSGAVRSRLKKLGITES